MEIDVPNRTESELQMKQREEENTNPSNSRSVPEKGKDDDRKRGEIRQRRWPEKTGTKTEKATLMSQVSRAVSEESGKIVVGSENRGNTQNPGTKQREDENIREYPNGDKAKNKTTDMMGMWVPDSHGVKLEIQKDHKAQKEQIGKAQRVSREERQDCNPPREKGKTVQTNTLSRKWKRLARAEPKRQDDQETNDCHKRKTKDLNEGESEEVAKKMKTTYFENIEGISAEAGCQPRRTQWKPYAGTPGD